MGLDGLLQAWACLSPSSYHTEALLQTPALKNSGSRSRLLIWQMIKDSRDELKPGFAFSILRVNLCPWGIISLSATAEEAFKSKGHPNVPVVSPGSPQCIMGPGSVGSDVSQKDAANHFII